MTGGAAELGHQILHRFLQLVVDLLAVARLPELAAAAAHLIPLGEGPVGPALVLLAVEQAAVDAVEQIELHAKVADGVFIPAGQLVALRFEGEIVDAAEHQILAVGAQAERLDLLEGAAIPCCRWSGSMRRFSSSHWRTATLRRVGQGLEHAA